MSYQPNQPAPQPKPLDPDKMLTDPSGYQSDLLGNVAGAMQTVMGQNTAATFEALSSSAKHLSRSDAKNAPLWDKYGAEIEALANNPAIDPRIRGSKEFWDKAATVVKAEHLDDIVNERAQQMVAEMGPNVETGSGSYGATDATETTAIEKMRTSEWGKRLLDRYGERGVIRTAEKMGVSLDKYADMVVGTNVIVNPNNPSEWWNRDLMRGT